MSYRFTDTDKWQDGWFVNLKPTEKLLFMYLCDNCDIAGFIEINIKKWVVDTGFIKSQIEGALKGLRRGLIYSNTDDCIYIRNFLKHQKNLPLNEKNQAHKGIIKRFEKYSHKFEITDYNEFVKGAQEGLRRGTGKGIGNVFNDSIEKNTIITNSNKLQESIDYYNKEAEEFDNNQYRFLVKFILGENEINEPLEKCLLMKHPINRKNFDRLLKKSLKNGRKLTTTILALENDQRQIKPKKIYPSFSMTISNWLDNSRK